MEVGIPSGFKTNFLGLGALLARSFAIVLRNLTRPGTALAERAGLIFQWLACS